MSSILLLLTLMLRFMLMALVVVVIAKSILRKGSKRLPPGPYIWQLLNTLPELGEKPHVVFTSLSKIYGPVFSFRVGMQVIIVASTPQVAKEIFTNKRLSGRFLPAANYNVPGSLEKSVAGSKKCTEIWKELRQLAHQFIFSNTAINSKCLLREKKLMEMVGYIRSKTGEEVNVEHLMSATVTNMFCNILVSKDLVGVSDDGNSRKMGDLIQAVVDSGIGMGLADLFPVLAKLDIWAKRKGKEMYENTMRIWGQTIKTRRNHLQPADDFLKVLFDQGYSDDEIALLLMELLAAGTESTVATALWLMMQVLRNPDILRRVVEEVAMIFDESGLDESKLAKCKYFNACLKETLRLHTPGPFGVPHRAIEACEINNYFIPENSILIVNFWGIHIDPTNWENPTCFQPERFVKSTIDFTGGDFQLLPFGSGQRMCPGSNVAIKNVQVMVASLLHFFDWTLPGGVPTSDIDMACKFGTVFKKDTPLLLIPKHRRSLNFH